MTLALYILIAIVGVGLVLKFTDRPSKAANAPEEPPHTAPQECCGQHAICERDSLLISSDAVEYFDDEELDAFRGRGADEYTDSETEQFRDVLLTLLPDDIAPWARSIRLRGINLPTVINQELLMMVAENRAAHNTSSTPHDAPVI